MNNEGKSIRKKICDKCKIIKRNGKVMVICENQNTNKNKVNRRKK